MVQGPWRAGRGCLCERQGRGRAGRCWPRAPRACPSRAVESAAGCGPERRGVWTCGPGPHGPAGARLPPPPPPRAWGTGVHRTAKGTFATFQRARTGQAQGGDQASGANSACLAQPGRRASHSTKER